ncbi:MAG: hypothetical protein AAF938_24955 [Myxococcota bacterium]
MKRIHLLGLLFITSTLGCGGDATSPGIDTGGMDAGGIDTRVDPQDGEGTTGCNIAECRDGVAVTCDGELSLRCGEVGATCAVFDTPEDGQLGWCECGDIAEGESACLNERDAVLCESGVALPAECAPGTACAPDGTSAACFCDDLEDGICPEGCTGDPDCAECVPSCAGATCGDNGCGGSCGSCGLGERCDAGECVATCTPTCNERQCGSDGCGGSCGSCADGTCNEASGQCETECIPFCAEGACSDGCGGDCGVACEDGLECDAVRNACLCSVYDQVTYDFNGSAWDWREYGVNRVTVHGVHTEVNGDERPFVASDALRFAPVTLKTIFRACVPNATVRFVYTFADLSECEVFGEASASITETSELLPLGVRYRTQTLIPEPVGVDERDTCPRP